MFHFAGQGLAQAQHRFDLQLKRLLARQPNQGPKTSADVTVGIDESSHRDRWLRAE